MSLQRSITRQRGQRPPTEAPARTRLAIGCPSYDGKLYGATCWSICETMRVMDARGFTTDFVLVPNNSLLPCARAGVIAGAMVIGADWLLLIDSDVSFDADGVLRLLGHGHDFACGALPKKAGDEFHFRPAQPLRHCPRTGCIEVVGTSLGFVLLKRSVIERLIEAHPERKFSGLGMSEEADRFCYDLFPIAVVGDEMHGEDFGFCRLWRELGGTIWCDPHIRLSHHGRNLVFSGCLADTLAEEQSQVGGCDPMPA